MGRNHHLHRQDRRNSACIAALWQCCDPDSFCHGRGCSICKLSVQVRHAHCQAAGAQEAESTLYPFGAGARQWNWSKVLRSSHG